MARFRPAQNISKFDGCVLLWQSGEKLEIWSFLKVRALVGLRSLTEAHAFPSFILLALQSIIDNMTFSESNLTEFVQGEVM